MKKIKKRFWFLYYWLMTAYLVLALFLILFFKITHTDRQLTDYTVLNCAPLDYSGLFDSACQQGGNYSSVMGDINEFYFFDFITLHTRHCRDANLITRELGEFDPDCLERNIDVERWTSLDNLYPFLIVLIMTIIRWIFRGKHIWSMEKL